MPRFLRPTWHLSTLHPSRGGVRIPGVADLVAPALIMPQVIEWPWTTDDAGVAFPAGIVGIRSVSPGRTQEAAWATPGDPDEDDDDWIAVPDTLPGGYTAQPGRWVNRGPLGLDEFAPWTKGAPYFTVAHNGLGDNTGGAFGNYTAGGVGDAYRMSADYTVNGLSPRSTDAFMPSYRPKGGGGVVQPTWFPLNVAKSVIACRFFETGSPSSYVDAFIRANHLQSIDLWTPYHPGFRSIRARLCLSATDVQWATATAANLKVQVRIGHNADESQTGFGDTQDYLSGLYGPADFSTGPDVGFGIKPRYLDVEVLDSSYTLPSPGDAFRSWCIVVACGTTSAAGGGPPFGASTDYQNRVTCSPRLDVPPWFSVYGAGLGAPGGLP